MHKKLRVMFILIATIAFSLLVSSELPADSGTCGGASTMLPFADVMGSTFFCQIAEAYFSGLTNGTTPTTYSPSDPVLRDQMAAFVTRTQDSALRRGGRRAALGQWARPSAVPVTGRTAVGTVPVGVKSDGDDLWVAENSSGDVEQVSASTGAVVNTWTGATNAYGVLVARGQVFITGNLSPGRLYAIDPAAGLVTATMLSNTLGGFPSDLTTDGTFIWTANNGGSVSKVDPDTRATINLTTGFAEPWGILFDGVGLWVTDAGDNKLKKLDANGTVIQTVAVGSKARFPVFDGSNIWVPNLDSNSVTVVRSRDGAVLATLTGNGLSGPVQAAFDGQFILVTNNSGNSVSMWKAVDLTPVGTFATGASTSPYGVCSDGINFWMTLDGTSQLARF
jgi:hypothetical protein